MMPSSLVSLLYTVILSSSATSAVNLPIPTPAVTSNSIPAPFAVPLLRHKHQLVRRSNPVVLREWALREKGRIRDKYEADQDGHQLVKRATTPISTAGVGSPTPSSSLSDGSSLTLTSTAKASLPTSPVGLVQVMNYEADL